VLIILSEDFYVFEIIRRKLKELFNPMSIESNQLLLEEADILMKHINEAKTLGQLLAARAQLKEYREMVERVNAPSSVKQKLVFLEARWNRQFRIWKSRR
jgi:hypothetical protein